MQNVISFPSVAALSLFAIQAVLVLIRTSSCLRPSVPLLLSGFLLAMTSRLAPFSGAALRELLLIAAIWAAGAFLIRATSRRMLGPWVGGCAALCLMLAFARALGLEKSVPYTALRSFGIALLAATLLGMLFRIWHQKRSYQALATFVAGCAWLIDGSVRTIMASAAVIGTQFRDIPELLLCLCTGWLVFQEGYPERTAWRGSLQSLEPKEGLVQSMYARLLATENALAWQEKVTAAGFLALGAAHEFKNILSHVRLAAQHGMAQEEPGRKDECLHLILESANTGRDSAVEVLERISSSGGEVPCVLDAANDLRGPIRRASVAIRGEGIIVQIDFDAGVVFRARRFEVEQIILNLIHNSAESYRRCPEENERLITISARTEDEWAIIEVRDSAGGVEESVRPRLFTPAASASGSTGLGLYLSRQLALANGGGLDYQPTDGGSSFRLALPSAE
jgi:signal transduction histidine kinase